MRYVKKNDIFITKIASSFTKEGPDNRPTLPILYHLNLSTNDYKSESDSMYGFEKMQKWQNDKALQKKSPKKHRKETSNLKTNSIFAQRCVFRGPTIYYAAM